jgi:hypothetical protein
LLNESSSAIGSPTRREKYAVKFSGVRAYQRVDWLDPKNTPYFPSA